MPEPDFDGQSFGKPDAYFGRMRCTARFAIGAAVGTLGRVPTVSKNSIRLMAVIAGLHKILVVFDR